MTGTVGTRWIVLMACHDRRPLTLASLDHLAACRRPDGLQLDVILVDDGSTDGTAAAVAEQHPNVHIITADGTLFWGRAMHRAFARAVERGADAYLWLNDDTRLAPEALQILADGDARVRSRSGAPGIIVGTTVNPDTREPIFGGAMMTRPRTLLATRLVVPGNEPRPCEMMHGNCTLIPSEVADRVGNIDPIYEHGLGDYDYGLRARSLGIGLWVAPGVVGSSAPHEFVNHDAMPVRARLRRFASRHMLPPRSWAHFCRRWAGPLWPLIWVWPYVKVIAVPWLRRALRRSNVPPARS
jgi:GT2 family glycosyltransferase